MKIIGITGGVGAGKSELLSYIIKKYNAGVIYADKVANDLKMKGQPCYDPIVNLLGYGILDSNGEIDKTKMAARIFSDKDLLQKINEILHPAVRVFILEQIALEREQKKIDFLFIEAALLIEEHYDEICDELWYIYADKEVRKKRLSHSRGYTTKKTEQIMKKQLAEETFRLHCKVVIDNSKELLFTYKQIDRKLEEYL